MQSVHAVFGSDLRVASFDRLPWPRVLACPSFLAGRPGPPLALDPLDGEHDIGLLLVPSSPYFPNQGIRRQDLGDLSKQGAQ